MAGTSPGGGGTEHFDVFLCYNGDDEDAVEAIASHLRDRGIRPWFAKWELRPGVPWQRLLEEKIAGIEAAAVFVGANGTGPWQDLELEAYMREFVRRECPVIPVILPGASDKPSLPVFLSGMTWVDFDRSNLDPIEHLIWGITGQRTAAVEPADAAAEPKTKVRVDEAESTSVDALTMEVAARPPGLFALPGLRSTAYDVRLRNKARAPVVVVLEVSDEDGRCTFSLLEIMEVPAEMTTTISLKVWPKRRRWRPGRESREFIVSASGDSGAPAVTASGTFADEPYPWRPAGGFLGAGGVLGVLIAAWMMFGGDGGDVGGVPAPTITAAPTTSVPATATADAAQFLDPIDTVPLGARTLAAGTHFTCALTSDAGVACWGDNTYGQLGDGGNEKSFSPVDVLGLTSGVQAISAGGTHACALLDTRNVKCWGQNNRGQLGNGRLEDSAEPVAVMGISGATLLVTGTGFETGHTCAIVPTGMKCWGANQAGQLGDGNVKNESLEPVDVLGLAGGVMSALAGTEHTCALLDTGVVCWGRNSEGQLGDGTFDASSTPVSVQGLPPENTMLAAEGVGGTLSCAISSSATLCWGENGRGQVGNGSTDDQNRPADVVGDEGPLAGAVAITVGRVHTCAIVTSEVRCWGASDNGQLGKGLGTTDMLRPADPVDLHGPPQEVVAGGFHTCVRVDGAVWCWGNNGNGQLGDGSQVDKFAPVRVFIDTAAGDVNCDESVNSVDASLTLQLTAGLLGGLKCDTGDVNGDKLIDARDATVILQFTVGLVTALPVRRAV